MLTPTRLMLSFQEHYDDLLNFLTRRMSDRQRACDVAQETYLKLLKVEQQSVSVENERGFIFRVAGNLAIDTLRRDQRQSASQTETSLEAIDPTPQPEAALLAHERLAMLDEALQQLSPNARQALLLNRIEGLTQAQIAEQLGVSPSMVAKYIGQALRHCRDWLKHNHV